MAFDGCGADRVFYERAPGVQMVQGEPEWLLRL